MANLLVIELIVVGIIFIFLIIVGLLWFSTKNKRLEKILGKIKDFLTSLLQYV